MQIKNKINFYTIGIAIVLVFSFVIRIQSLSTNPAGFFADEASVGVDAYSIYKTGKDRHGDFFPLFFKGFNFDNVSPYQVYLTVPFVALFGLDETAVRLAPVFWSTFELLIFYLLLSQLLSKPYALVGTIMLSLSPWHFHISRINMGDYYSWTLLTLLAYLFLTYGFKNGKTYLFVISAFFFALATYSYTPARLITPFLFILSILTVRSKNYLKIPLLMVVTYIAVLIPFLYFHITNPHAFQRIEGTVGIEIDTKTETIREQNSGAFAIHVFNKYLLHYSDLFLFQKGDADFPGQIIRRHSIPGLGLLYPYQKILILAGIIWLSVQILRTKRYELLFIVLLLIYFPTADSLTFDKTPFATRSYLGVLPFHLLIAFGINGVYEQFKKLAPDKVHILRILMILSLIYFITSSGQTLFRNFSEAPKTTSSFLGWQYGSRDIIRYFLAVSHQYDELYMSREFSGADIFISFYDPKNLCDNKCRIGDFYNQPEIYDSSKRQLFSLSPDYLSQSNFDKKFLVKKTIYYPSGTIAFRIGEIAK